ncbi:hypothetical protein LI276_23260, partial [[Clostridium] scindens]|uniref:hypothetical protein n=1 Tax=Clostridium scindens (strain JCM 10418 / VPI 12708) TaxID=29347 RepID=UPI001D05DAA3
WLEKSICTKDGFSAYHRLYRYYISIIKLMHHGLNSNMRKMAENLSLVPFMLFGFCFLCTFGSRKAAIGFIFYWP